MKYILIIILLSYNIAKSQDIQGINLHQIHVDLQSDTSWHVLNDSTKIFGQNCRKIIKKSDLCTIINYDSIGFQINLQKYDSVSIYLFLTEIYHQLGVPSDYKKFDDKITYFWYPYNEIVVIIEQYFYKEKLDLLLFDSKRVH